MNLCEWFKPLVIKTPIPGVIFWENDSTQLIKCKYKCALLSKTVEWMIQWLTHRLWICQLFRKNWLNECSKVMIYGATFLSNVTEWCCLGTFPLRMGNTFPAGYFWLVVGPMSHLVACWWQHCSKSCPVYNHLYCKNTCKDNHLSTPSGITM